MVPGDGNKPQGSIAGRDCSLPKRRGAGTRTLVVGLMEQQAPLLLICTQKSSCPDLPSLLVVIPTAFVTSRGIESVQVMITLICGKTVLLGL